MSRLLTARGRIDRPLTRRGVLFVGDRADVAQAGELVHAAFEVGHQGYAVSGRGRPQATVDIKPAVVG